MHTYYEFNSSVHFLCGMIINMVWNYKSYGMHQCF